MLSICLCVMFMAGFGYWIEVQVRATEARRRALRIDDVAKELASWDRTKELGFDDVLLWEAAFEKATGALPERSRTKELAAKYRVEMDKQQQSYVNRLEYDKRLLAQSRLAGNYMQLGAPIKVESSYFGTGRFP